MIQQIIASILTFLLCYVLSDTIIVVGEKLGLDGVLGWCVITFVILLSVWKLVAKDWGLGDAVALMMISAVVMLYYYDVGKLIGEIAKTGLAIGAGVVIGYLIRNNED
jgi:hypothetical protein